MRFTMPTMSGVPQVEGSPIALVPNAPVTTVPTSPPKTTVVSSNAFKGIQILNPRQLLPITYIPASLPAGAILSPQIISTTARLPILASPTMLGVNQPMGMAGQQVIALNQLQTGDATTAGFQMFSIQLPKKFESTSTDGNS